MSATLQQDRRSQTTNIIIHAQPCAVCVLHDASTEAAALQDKLASLGYSSFATSDPQEALERVSSRKCRVVLCDTNNPGTDDTFLQKGLKRDPELYVILLTDSYSPESAIDAIRRGAYDYLPKAFDRMRLKQTLDDIDKALQLQRRLHALDQGLASDIEFHGIVGRSPAILDVLDFARKIAPHYSSVLLTGQTGTGKERIAHAIRDLSPVANQRFAACDCSAAAATMLESRLFGHVRGAFAGATDTRPGLLEWASGGTVFLNDVAELSPAMQAKLLRVVRDREIQRVGSPEARRVDVRVIAATHRDLRAEVLAGRFREDLSDQLSALQIRVPSLLERIEDVPLLMASFLKKCNATYHKTLEGFTRRAQTALRRYPWPGNVRELENVISSAALAATNNFIDLDDFPEQFRIPLGCTTRAMPWRPLPLEQVCDEHIRSALNMCGGNRVQTAKLLGIGRTSLYRFLRRDRAASQEPR